MKKLVILTGLFIALGISVMEADAKESRRFIESNPPIVQPVILREFTTPTVKEEYDPFDDVLTVPYERVQELVAERRARIQKEEEEKRKREEEAKRRAAAAAQGSSLIYSSSSFYRNGVIYWGGYRWTWYSQRVLPGYGLNIPGRHVDANGYVCDSNGYIVIASRHHAKGTVISTPLGKNGKVYDYCPEGALDVYVNW